MTTTANTRRNLFWPVLLTSLIAIHIVSVVIMVIVATHDRSFAIEPDFYQKGLRYDQDIRQRQENARLGWTVKLDVSGPMSGTNLRNVNCRLLDRDGKPLDGATIDLVAFAHLRASQRQSRVLLPRNDGNYVCTIACVAPGMWEFRLNIARGKETFTTIVKQEM